MQKRSSSWRQLLKQHKLEFQEWLEENGDAISIYV